MATYVRSLGQTYNEFKNALNKKEYSPCLVNLGLYDRKTGSFTAEGFSLANEKDGKAFAGKLLNAMAKTFPEVVDSLKHGVFGSKYQIIDKIFVRCKKRYSSSTIGNILTYLDKAGGFQVVKTLRFNDQVLGKLIIIMAREMGPDGEKIIKEDLIDRVCITCPASREDVAVGIDDLASEQRLQYFGGGNLFVRIVGGE
ncbi:MAG: hypothetical protein V1792_01455 [Pseudomonadota bacterium]